MKKVIIPLTIFTILIILIACAPEPEAPAEKEPATKDRGGIPQIEITPITTMPPKPEVEPPPTEPPIK